jgi:hypothetical protein
VVQHLNTPAAAAAATTATAAAAGDQGYCRCNRLEEPPAETQLLTKETQSIAVKPSTLFLIQLFLLLQLLTRRCQMHKSNQLVCYFFV